MTALTKEERRRRRIAIKVSKMTPDTIQKIESAFIIDATVEEACFYANISTSTYYNWIERHPDLLDRFTALRTQPVLKARQTIVRSLDDPDHAFNYLKSKRPEEFGNRSKIELAGKMQTEDVTTSEATRAITKKYEEEYRKAIVEEGRKRP